MRRFYFDPLTRQGEEVVLSEEESHHIVKVLRLSAGERVELLDGQGSVFRAVIVATGRRVTLHLDGLAAAAPEEGKTLWVAQGLLKGDKMDTVVQKCTELGVARFMPFISSRCQGRLDNLQARKKQERWQRIGLEACKQCLRLRLPRIDSPAGFEEFLRSGAAGNESFLKLMFWEEEKEVHLRDLPEISGAGSTILLLGPEGGLTGREVELARDAGFRTVSLGERILRAETATLAAVAVVQFLAGNL